MPTQIREDRSEAAVSRDHFIRMAHQRHALARYVLMAYCFLVTLALIVAIGRWLA